MASGVVATVINAIAMMAAFPIYLHFLGYEKYGVWLVLATVLTFARLGDLGIKNAMMKIVAEEYGRNNIYKIQKHIATGLMMLCISGGIILGLLLVLENQIVATFNLSDDNVKIALWLLPYIGILSIYLLATEVLQGSLAGLGRMDLVNCIRAIEPAVKAGVGISLLALGFGIKSMLIGSVVSLLGVHLASLFFIRRIVPIRIFKVGNLRFRYAKHIMCFGGPLFGGSLFGMIVRPLINILLVRYGGVASLPIYEIASRGGNTVKLVVSSCLVPLMPEFSRLSGIANGANERMSLLYNRSMKLVLLMGITLYAGLFVTAPMLFQLWLGSSFVETIPTVFRVMLIATFIVTLGTPAEYILTGLGYVGREFLARFMQQGVVLVLIIIVALSSSHLSPLSIALCMLPAALISSIYRMLTSRLVVTQYKTIRNSPTENSNKV